MGSAVALRSDYTAIDLRRLAKGYDDNRQIRRLLALAAVYDGMNRTEAARVGGMDRQTLRDRVHRFNEYGPDGLINAQGAGRPRSLNDKQMRDLAQIVETGPDLESDGVVRWRRIDLVRVVRERFGVECSERSMSDYLAELGFSNISGRPQHPRQDGRVIEAFKKTSPRRSQPTWPICLKAHLLKYGSRMRRVSARRTVRCASGHAREPAHACQPTSAMKIRTCSAPSVPGERRVPCSFCRRPTPKPCSFISTRSANTSTGKLNVLENITIILLPSKSPELNPVENIWQYLRSNYLSNRAFKDYTVIVDAACDAWNALIDTLQAITSIGMRDWAHV